MNTKPSWWPTKPSFNILISPLPKGSARNEKCKCGSGLKAKRCTACGHGLPPLHYLTYTQYEDQEQESTIQNIGYDEENDHPVSKWWAWVFLIGFALSIIAWLAFLWGIFWFIRHHL